MGSSIYKIEFNKSLIVMSLKKNNIMRKISLLICLICFLHIRSNGQESANIRIKKTEILSFKDVKPFLKMADPDKSYDSYRVLGFTLTGLMKEGINTISFIESSPCGTLTEKQLSLIEKHRKQGMVFTLEEITMVKLVEPGTPYKPNEEIISVPNVSFLVSE